MRKPTFTEKVNDLRQLVCEIGDLNKQLKQDTNRYGFVGDLETLRLGDLLTPSVRHSDDELISVETSLAYDLRLSLIFLDESLERQRKLEGDRIDAVGITPEHLTKLIDLAEQTPSQQQSPHLAYNRALHQLLLLWESTHFSMHV